MIRYLSSASVLRTQKSSDWGCTMTARIRRSLSCASFMIRQASLPPIPAMRRVSASGFPSGHFMAESPSERRVSMYAESPASRICSPARSRGPGFTSMASTRGQIPRCTSQIEVNPWSQPTSAATLPRSTSRADIKSRSDSSISRFLPAISPDSPSACGCGWDDGAFSAPSPRSAGSAHGSR